MARYRPTIGILVDGVSAYGCGVLHGVTSYANLRRQWRLHTELWPVDVRQGRLPHCDGVIIAGQPQQVTDWAKRHVRHVILCSGTGDPARTPLVSVDNEAVGRIAAEHLLECQLQQFAFLGGTHIQTAQDRLTGFEQQLAKRGYRCIVSPRSLTAHAGWQLHADHKRIAQWLSTLPKPIGILTFDDATALTLATACLEAGVSVPERVAIVGVNNDGKLCESAWPPLSSVDCGWSRIGYEAAVLMEQLLAGQAVTDARRRVRIAPVGVVARQSTSLLAVEEHDLAEAIRFIREHACDPCTMRDVLYQVPVGRRWLERRFAKILGRSPRDEMVRVRIETAQRFLARTDMTLLEIAARCGYSKTSHFHSAFRSVSGETPAAYRRRVKAQLPENNSLRTLS